MPELARLESVDLREAWASEPADFTPWLYEHLDQLSADIGGGIELNAVGREVPVGNYRADIRAEDPKTGSVVLIENQLSDADPAHLGQLLTYLAGIGAKIVIWIARDFNDQQISAVRWLNEHTHDPYAFLAVQIRLHRIGDSALAPQFIVRERPINWDRLVASRSGVSNPELRQARFTFWRHYSARHPRDGIRVGFSSNVRISVGGPIDIRMYRGINGVGIYLSSDQADTQVVAALLADELKDKPDVIKNPVTGWRFLYIDPEDPKNLDPMVDWLHERRHVYERVLRTALAAADHAAASEPI